MRSEAARQSQGRGKEAHSGPAPSHPASQPLPSCPLTPARGARLDQPTCPWCQCLRSSVSLASRSTPQSPGPLAAWLGPGHLLWPRGCLWSHPRQPRASLLLFRQTNKTRFGYRGRAVRRPTQTEAARLASPSALGSVQAVPGHSPHSRSGLLTRLPRLVTHVPQPRHRGCEKWGQPPLGCKRRLEP